MERSYVPCKPDHMTALEQVSHEAMVFMRGCYCLDEVGNGRDELKFKQGKRTILTVYVKEDRFDFMLIYGKKEREVFEARRAEFPLWVLEIYDNAKTYHDGKWMMFPVSAPEQLEELKPLIFIKKKPNRKPFPKEGAVYGQCGQRCDLCVHYTGQDEDRRQRMGNWTGLCAAGAVRARPVTARTSSALPNPAPRRRGWPSAGTARSIPASGPRPQTICP